MTDKEKQIFDKYGNYNFPTDIKQSGQNIATTQIEEMAKVIESVKLYGIDNYGRKISHHSALELAEELLKHYQSKLPEGSVVMSEKEWQQIKNSLYYSKEELEKKLERARQETAREFAEKLENGIDNLDIILHEDNDEQYVSINQLLKFIDELAKQFGAR